MAPDLRGHGDSQWSPDGNYSIAGYIYDLAQLIHQQELAPVNIIAHSLGGMIALRYAGIYPDHVRRLISIEGLGASPRRREERAKRPMAERMQHWISEQRALSGRLPRRYSSIEDAFKRMQEANRHLSPEQARHLTQHGVNQNEDGTYSWKFDNYVRADRPYEMTGRRDRGAMAAHRLPDPPRLRQGELGLQPGEGRAGSPFPQRPDRFVRERRPLGPP